MAGYERAPLGDNVATGSGGNVTYFVSNHYGPRDTGKTKGVVKTEGSTNELVITFDGTDVSNGLALETDLQLPIGAVIRSAIVDIQEVFVLGGTTPTILIGKEGEEVDEGLVISEAQAESATTYNVTSTLTGEWALPLNEAHTVGIALGGTSPTSTAAGRAKIVIEYTVVGP